MNTYLSAFEHYACNGQGHEGNGTIFLKLVYIKSKKTEIRKKTGSKMGKKRAKIRRF